MPGIRRSVQQRSTVRAVWKSCRQPSRNIIRWGDGKHKWRLIRKFVYKQSSMGTAELRKEVHSLIEKADKGFLKKVYAMSKEQEKAIVVGYEVDGTPITQEDLIKQAREASAQVKTGNYITQEDLEKEMENW